MHGSLRLFYLLLAPACTDGIKCGWGAAFINKGDIGPCTPTEFLEKILIFEMHDSANKPMTVATIVPVVYDELRNRASRLLANERRDHMFQTTALVHELYLRLADRGEFEVTSRVQFFRMAATAMRRILVDHARDRGRLKRGGGRRKLQLDGIVAAFEDRAFDLLALDEALKKLASVDPRQCQLVELRFFAGLSAEETAKALGVSSRTIERNWSALRLWLLREIKGA